MSTHATIILDKHLSKLNTLRILSNSMALDQREAYTHQSLDWSTLIDNLRDLLVVRCIHIALIAVLCIMYFCMHILRRCSRCRTLHCFLLLLFNILFSR